TAHPKVREAYLGSEETGC
ncbi:ABC transporter ATP-binding protein C-terminal domain-containing protein, partial [Deferrisoma sp.]